MSVTRENVIEDMHLRDAARALVDADWENLRADLQIRGVGARAMDRLTDGASDVYQEAMEVASDHKGALAAIVAEYERECEASRAAVAGADLDDPARGPDMTFNLRYAFTHMIEETARHCGHLDLLREVTDGRTGQ